MSGKRFFSLCIHFLLIFLCLPACFALSPKVYVGNFSDNTISVIDSSSNKVLATIPNIQGPAAMSMTPDGHYLFVSESHSFSMAVIDTTSDRLVTRIECGRIPEGMAMSSSGKFMLASTLGTDSLVLIDIKTKEVANKILIGKAWDLVMNRENTLAYASMQDPDQYAINVIDVSKFSLLKSIPLKNEPGKLALSPDQQSVYFASDLAQIQAIDLKTFNPVHVISVDSPIQGLAFTHNGKLGLATGKNNQTVYLFNPENDSIENQITVGKQPYDISISQDDRFAYVSNEISNTVSVLDLNAKKIVASIPVGNNPHFILIQPKTFD